LGRVSARPKTEKIDRQQKRNIKKERKQNEKIDTGKKPEHRQNGTGMREGWRPERLLLNVYKNIREYETTSR